MSSNTKRNLFLIILIVGVLSMTIAFAAFSTTLKIGGSVGISKTTWDIHFSNFSSSSTPETTTLGETNTGVLKSVSTNETQISSLKVDLKKPGDIVVYTFDITNSGTIDAKLSSFINSITCEVDNSCGYADYSVSCLDSSENNVAVNSVLAKGESFNCTVSVKYNDSYTSLSDDVAASLSASWQFIQN